MSGLSGKVALVTGGSRGIGAAIALRLAADGADVALTYVNSQDKAKAVAAQIENHGGRARAWQVDSANTEAIIGAIDRTVDQLGRLDILVNSAGIFIRKPLDEYTPEDFELSIAVNVRAVFFSIQAAARHMSAGGRIITIGSNVADRVPRAGATLYSMSKSALIGLTKGAARDLGPQDITVNVIQPGPTNTDMNPADGPRADAARALMAIARYGEGADIAGLVAYLASEAGRFITGTALTIDGGANA